MCPEGDTGQEHALDFLYLWGVTYTLVCLSEYQIVIIAKHTMWQHMVPIKAKWSLITTTTC